MAKNKRKKTVQMPDEQFTSGPFRFERYGRFTTAQSTLSMTEHADLMVRFKEDFPAATAKVEALVQSITSRVRSLPPDRLLHRAWWEFAGVTLGIYGTKTDDQEQSLAMRMIDYIQSVIASTEPVLPHTQTVSEKEWVDLKADVRSLFSTLTLRYQWARRAVKRQEADYNEALVEFQYRAEIMWMNVRGSRYQAHEYEALLDLLTPHSDVLVELFGIDAVTLAGNLQRILDRLTKGLADLFADMKSFENESRQRMEELISTGLYSNLEEVRREIFKDQAFSDRSSELAGLFIGLDFFDVEKISNLPKTLIDVLTWSLGEENDFFADGDYCGWPLRVWPTMKRPFIRINGQICCFDFFSLFDNFYRVLQRVIFRLKPAYRAIWNTRQQAISEELPLSILSEILPGAEVHSQVYYRWSVDQGPAQWFEADAILIYEDHLFVIEVKAGAFTYTSPSTDLPSHLTSLRNLITNPASQGSRFLDYLDSALEVSIFNNEHQLIRSLQKNSFRHITVCAITLDAFTELAARAQHLQDIGIDVGSKNIWSLSIDDLRVYRDFFKEPLYFLHFVEQRMLAAKSKLVDLNDELEHIGLYIRQNNYSQHAEEIVGKGDAHLTFDGFRTPIDEYYSALAQGEEPAIPVQETPKRIAEIITFLTYSNIPNKAELSSYLLDLSGDFRQQIADSIDTNLDPEKPLGFLSTHGEIKLTLMVFIPNRPRDAAHSIFTTRTVMAVHDEKSRFLIELEYSNAGELVETHWNYVTLIGLNDEELEIIYNNADVVRKRRLFKARTAGKIGVNKKCPCGSDKKYKRCCGRT
jgi:hypothetical protein